MCSFDFHVIHILTLNLMLVLGLVLLIVVFLLLSFMMILLLPTCKESEQTKRSHCYIPRSTAPQEPREPWALVDPKSRSSLRLLPEEYESPEVEDLYYSVLYRTILHYTNPEPGVLLFGSSRGSGQSHASASELYGPIHSVAALCKPDASNKTGWGVARVSSPDSRNMNIDNQKHKYPNR